MQLDTPDLSAPERQIWSGNNITQKLNEVYAQESSELDPVLLQMQMASLEVEIW